MGKKLTILTLALIVVLCLCFASLTQAGKPPAGTPTPNPTPTPGVEQNLALNKAVTYSSQAVGFEAAKAVDGDLGTRWEANAFPQWLYR